MKSDTYVSRLVYAIEAILATIPFAVYGVMYRYLPEEIPVHFGSDGTPDAFADKVSIETVLICSLGLLGFAIGTILVRLTNEGMKNAFFSQSTYAVLIAKHSPTMYLILFFDTLSIYIFLIMLQEERFNVLEVVRLAFTVGFIAMLAVARVFPQIKRNKYFGIRCSRTLKSDLQWNYVHQKCGRLMCGASIIGFAVSSIWVIPTCISLVLDAMVLFGLTLACILSIQKEV